MFHPSLPLIKKNKNILQAVTKIDRLFEKCIRNYTKPIETFTSL